MKVTLLQLGIEWGNPLLNITKAESLMALEPDTDLYVLPEMWSTGFATEPSGIAEEETGNRALEWMKNYAQMHHCAISGSLAIKILDSNAQTTYKNRHYFVDGPNEACYYYDKHHLFRYGGEDRYYLPGEEHVIVSYKGFRFLLLTCYDLRFPVWSRYSDNLQFDAIIAVANWPDSRQNAWQILTRARAIENQAFLIACNRVGKDAYSYYRGQSAVISPIGKTIVCCKPHVEQAVSCVLQLDELKRLREKFRVLDDRDLF